jgi:hypothetical protein
MRKAAEDLAGMIFDISPAVVAELTRQLRTPGRFGLLAGFFTGTVLRHVHRGAPLAMPVEVLRVLVDAGAEAALSGDPLECEGCGYVLPRTFTVCPLCGGRVGLALWSRRQARRAASN